MRWSSIAAAISLLLSVALTATSATGVISGISVSGSGTLATRFLEVKVSATAVVSDAVTIRTKITDADGVTLRRSEYSLSCAATVATVAVPCSIGGNNVITIDLPGLALGDTIVSIAIPTVTAYATSLTANVAVTSANVELAVRTGLSAEIAGAPVSAAASFAFTPTSGIAAGAGSADGVYTATFTDISTVFTGISSVFLFLPTNVTVPSEAVCIAATGSDWAAAAVTATKGKTMQSVDYITASFGATLPKTHAGTVSISCSGTRLAWADVATATVPAARIVVVPADGFSRRIEHAAPASKLYVAADNTRITSYYVSLVLNHADGKCTEGAYADAGTHFFPSLPTPTSGPCASTTTHRQLFYDLTTITVAQTRELALALANTAVLQSLAVTGSAGAVTGATLAYVTTQHAWQCKLDSGSYETCAIPNKCGSQFAGAIKCVAAGEDGADTACPESTKPMAQGDATGCGNYKCLDGTGMYVTCTFTCPTLCAENVEEVADQAPPVCVLNDAPQNAVAFCPSFARTVPAPKKCSPKSGCKWRCRDKQCSDPTAYVCSDPGAAGRDCGSACKTVTTTTATCVGDFGTVSISHCNGIASWSTAFTPAQVITETCTAGYLPNLALAYDASTSEYTLSFSKAGLDVKGDVHIEISAGSSDAYDFSRSTSVAAGSLTNHIITLTKAQAEEQQTYTVALPASYIPLTFPTLSARATSNNVVVGSEATVALSRFTDSDLMDVASTVTFQSWPQSHTIVTVARFTNGMLDGATVAYLELRLAGAPGTPLAQTTLNNCVVGHIVSGNLRPIDDNDITMTDPVSVTAHASDSGLYYYRISHGFANGQDVNYLYIGCQAPASMALANIKGGLAVIIAPENAPNTLVHWDLSTPKPYAVCTQCSATQDRYMEASHGAFPSESLVSSTVGSAQYIFVAHDMSFASLRTHKIAMYHATGAQLLPEGKLLCNGNTCAPGCPAAAPTFSCPVGTVCLASPENEEDKKAASYGTCKLKLTVTKGSFTFFPSQKRISIAVTPADWRDPRTFGVVLRVGKSAFSAASLSSASTCTSPYSAADFNSVARSTACTTDLAVVYRSKISVNGATTAVFFDVDVAPIMQPMWGGELMFELWDITPGNNPAFLSSEGMFGAGIVPMEPVKTWKQLLGNGAGIVAATADAIKYASQKSVWFAVDLKRATNNAAPPVFAHEVYIESSISDVVFSACSFAVDFGSNELSWMQLSQIGNLHFTAGNSFIIEAAGSGVSLSAHKFHFHCQAPASSHLSSASFSLYIYSFTSQSIAKIEVTSTEHTFVSTPETPVYARFVFTPSKASNTPVSTVLSTRGVRNFRVIDDGSTTSHTCMVESATYSDLSLILIEYGAALDSLAIMEESSLPQLTCTSGAPATCADVDYFNCGMSYIDSSCTVTVADLTVALSDSGDKIKIDFKSDWEAQAQKMQVKITGTGALVLKTAYDKLLSANARSIEVELKTPLSGRPSTSDEIYLSFRADDNLWTGSFTPVILTKYSTAVSVSGNAPSLVDGVMSAEFSVFLPGIGEEYNQIAVNSDFSALAKYGVHLAKISSAGSGAAADAMSKQINPDGTFDGFVLSGGSKYVVLLSCADFSAPGSDSNRLQVTFFSAKFEITVKFTATFSTSMASVGDLVYISGVDNSLAEKTASAFMNWSILSGSRIVANGDKSNVFLSANGPLAFGTELSVYQDMAGSFSSGSAVQILQSGVWMCGGKTCMQTECSDSFSTPLSCHVGGVEDQAAAHCGLDTKPLSEIKAGGCVPSFSNLGFSVYSTDFGAGTVTIRLTLTVDTVTDVRLAHTAYDIVIDSASRFGGSSDKCTATGIGLTCKLSHSGMTIAVPVTALNSEFFETDVTFAPERTLLGSAIFAVTISPFGHTTPNYFKIGAAAIRDVFQVSTGDLPAAILNNQFVSIVVPTSAQKPHHHIRFASYLTLTGSLCDVHVYRDAETFTEAPVRSTATRQSSGSAWYSFTINHTGADSFATIVCRVTVGTITNDAAAGVVSSEHSIAAVLYSEKIRIHVVRPELSMHATVLNDETLNLSPMLSTLSTGTVARYAVKHEGKSYTFTRYTGVLAGLVNQLNLAVNKGSTNLLTSFAVSFFDDEAVGWVCGSGSDWSGHKCQISNSCGTLQHGVACKTTSVGASALEIGGGDSARAFAVCGFTPLPLSSDVRGCGAHKCRNPVGDIVSCNDASVCLTGCRAGVQLTENEKVEMLECVNSAGATLDKATFCPRPLLPMPAFNERCNAVTTCARQCRDSRGTVFDCRTADTWSACSATCGPGTQTRNVVCGEPTAVGRILSIVVDNAFCAANEEPGSAIPATERTCLGTACTAYVWKCRNVSRGDEPAGNALVDCNAPEALALCSSDCGPGSRIRTPVCTSRSPAGDDFELDGPSTPCDAIASRPSATVACEGACTSVEWRCYASGAAPATASRCDGPVDSFSACPVTGCTGISTVARSVGCFSGSRMLSADFCSAPAPAVVRECAAVTSTCAVRFSVNTPCTADGTHVTCQATDTETTPIRAGVCSTPTGAAVPDAWCGDAPRTQACSLPPCDGLLTHRWRTTIGACVSGAEAVCRSYAPVTSECVACTAPPGGDGAESCVAVADSNCGTARPSAIDRACAARSCGAASTCTLSPVTIGTEAFDDALGRCVCGAGLAGPMCDVSMAVSQVNGVTSAGDSGVMATVSWTVDNAAALSTLDSSTTATVVLEQTSTGARFPISSVPLMQRTLTFTPADHGIVTGGSYTATVRAPGMLSSTSARFNVLAACTGKCLNDGFCSLTGTCTCRSGFTGAACEVDPCVSNGCNLMGGTCGAETNFACVCRKDADGRALFVGARCNTPAGGCSTTESCVNGMRAGIIENGKAICRNCVCNPNFSGTACETCDLDVVCTANGGSVKSGCSGCSCPEGRHGDTCACRHVVVTANFPYNQTSSSATLSAWLRMLEFDLTTAAATTGVSVWTLISAVRRATAEQTLLQVKLAVGTSCAKSSFTVSALRSAPQFVVTQVAPEDANMHTVWAAAERIKEHIASAATANTEASSTIVSTYGVGMTDPLCASGASCPTNVGAGGSFVEYIAPDDGGGDNSGGDNGGGDNGGSDNGDGGDNGGDNGSGSGADDDETKASSKGLSQNDKIAIGVAVGVGGTLLLVVAFLSWKLQRCCFSKAPDAAKSSAENPTYDV